MPLDAFDHPHEQVVGVVVGRRPRVARSRARCRATPDRERVDHPQPALRRHPGRLDHVRARDVAAPGRDVDPVGADAPAARRRGRASRRTPRASRSAAGTSTRSSRPRRRARRCGSPRGSRSRRSAGTATRAPSAPGLSGHRHPRFVGAHHSVRSKRGRSTPGGSACSSSSLSRCAASVASATGRSCAGTSDQTVSSSSSTVRCPSAEGHDQVVLAVDAVRRVLFELALRVPHGRPVPGAQHVEVFAQPQTRRAPAGSPPSRPGRG